MSLERKDLRIKLDPDVHKALGVLAEVDDKELQALGEEIVTAYVRRRVHDANVIADRLNGKTESGSGRE